MPGNTEKGKPIERWGRKATGPMRSAGPPNERHRRDVITMTTGAEDFVAQAYDQVAVSEVIRPRP